MKERVLITGGAGFLGEALAKALLKKGYIVRVADYEDLEDKEGVEFHKVDLRDQEATIPVFEGVDYCLNMAALIGAVAYMDKYPASILADNTLIDVSTFEAARKNKIKRMLYASSSMVFEQAKSFPSKEEDVPKIPPPHNFYGFSKLVGEYFCRAYKDEYDLNYTIFRIFNAYGQGEKEKGKGIGFTHVIPDITKRILSGQYPLQIIGSGEQSRPFTHISDIVSAIVMLVESSKAVNEDFNIGNDQETKIIDLAKILWDLCERKEPFKVEHLPEFKHTTQRRFVDNHKLRSLGWEPRVSLEEGLKEIIEWTKKELQ